MTNFESLKREAVHLERQLEDKVSRYQQMTQKWNASAMNNDFSLSRAEQGLQEGDVSALQQDIQLLFGQLQDLIQSKLVQAASSPSQRAVCQRYREILQDLRSDYDKAFQLMRRSRERRELLAGTASSGDAESGGPDAATESLLRERNHINSSMNMAANVIGQAESVRSDLRFQGRSLRSASTMLSGLASNVPGLNNLIDNIRRRRSRDDKIVAGVIALCILFTLWYIF